MSEPILVSDAQTNVYGKIDYSLAVTFGTTSVSATNGKDLLFVRNSAGNYTLTFPTNYNRIHEFGLGFLKASGTILQGCIASQTIQTNGQVVIEIRNSSGTATDPANGDQCFINCAVSKDTLNDKF